MYYAGLDLHKRYFTLCVLTGDGQVVLDHRRLPADLEPLQSLLRELDAPVTVTVEATLQWAWLHDRLTRAGFPVCVAHPQQVKLITHARCKTDPIDARKLAELTRANLLPTIWVPTPEVRAWRQLVRSRASLVRLRTRAKNRIHGCLAAENLGVPSTDLFGRSGRAWLGTVPLPQAVRREIQVQLALITTLDEQITGFDGEVKRLAARQPAARVLQPFRGSALRSAGPLGGDWDERGSPRATSSRLMRAGAEHPQLGRQDRARVGQPCRQRLAQVDPDRSGPDAQTSPRPGALPL